MLHRLFACRPTWLWISIIAKSHLKSSWNFSNLHKLVIQHYWHLVSSNNKYWLKCIHFFFESNRKKQRSSAIWLGTDRNNKIFHSLRVLGENGRKNRQRQESEENDEWNSWVLLCRKCSNLQQQQSFNDQFITSSSIASRRWIYSTHSTFPRENLNR